MPFAIEVSTIVVRGRSGGAVVYDVGENRHEHHILKETRVPARISAETTAAAAALGRRIADALGYVGCSASRCSSSGTTAGSGCS